MFKDVDIRFGIRGWCVEGRGELRERVEALLAVARQMFVDYVKYLPVCFLVCCFYTCLVQREPSVLAHGALVPCY